MVDANPEHHTLRYQMDASRLSGREVWTLELCSGYRLWRCT
jgi:hypothetical protein